jgi:hypothetical protein
MYIEAQNPRQKGTKDDKSISSVVSLSVQPSGQPCVNRLRLIAIEENATNHSESLLTATQLFL